MEVRFSHDKNIAYLKLSGPVTDKEILGLFDVAVADDRYRLGMGRLWDFREADLAQLNAGTIAAMANHPMKYPSGINDVKVAFVASRALEFGLSRMFEVFAGNAGDTNVAVFYSMDEAEAWLQA